MLDNPLVPKQPDRPLGVIVLGRLSKPKETEEQTQESIDSSFAYAEEFIRRNYEGEVEFRFLGEQISGLVADRWTIREAEDLMATGEWDVLVGEDLGRIFRNPRHAYAFVQDCVDAQLRLICIADMLDTADENWETMLATAAMRHGLHIPDTRRRIKRKAKYAFREGGMVLKIKFGYLKLTREQAASGEFGPKDLRIARLPEQQWVFDKIRGLLVQTESPIRVADWLNDNKIPTGPYVKRDSWNVKHVKGLLTDPLVQGIRTFPNVFYRPILSTGKHRREKNANPETKYVSELAFMSAEEQAQMLSSVGWQLRWAAGVQKSDHLLKGKPRNRVPWPNQAAVCSVCGGRMFRIGEFLKCRNSRKANGGTCWNHIQVPVALLHERTISWIGDVLKEHPCAHQAMVDAAYEAVKYSQAHATAAQKDRQGHIDALLSQQDNLAKGIAEGGKLGPLVKLLKSVDTQLRRLQAQNESSGDEGLPPRMSKTDVAASLDRVLGALMGSSVELGDVLRNYFTSFVIYPVQALDSGQVHPRAVLRWHDCDRQEDQEPQVAEVTFDLFTPPVHIGLMPKIVDLRREKPKRSLRLIAPLVPTSYMTVKRALQYAALMEEKGVTEPFVVLTEKPNNASRWRGAM